MDKDEIIIQDRTVDLISPDMRRKLEEYSAAKLRQAEKREEARLNRVGLTDKLLDCAFKFRVLAHRTKRAVLTQKYLSESQR